MTSRQRPVREELAAPGEERTDNAQGDETHADGDHAMIELEHGRHVRTVFGCESAQAGHRFIHVAVHHEAQHSRDLNAVDFLDFASTQPKRYIGARDSSFS